MKSLYILLLAGISLLTSCNPIDADKRLVEVPAATIKRNVLIEDFTGQRCIFCPEAAETIAKLQATYGADKLIAVAIHAGQLAIKTSPSFVGLRTDAGDAYYKHWAIPNVPKAVINRRGGVLSKDAWAGKVYDEFNKTTNVNIELKCQYDADTRHVEIETDLSTLTTAVKGQLQLWLVEDDVIAPQLFPNNKLEKNHIHHHVFRAPVNGEWGTELTLSPEHAHKEKTTYMLPSGILSDKAWIVAFFYNDNGVQQVVRQKISNSQTNDKK